MNSIKIFQQRTFVDTDAESLDERINTWVQKMAADPVNGFAVVNWFPIDLGDKSGYTVLYKIYAFQASRGTFME